MKKGIQGGCASVLAIFYATWGTAGTAGYAFNEIVPDVRQPASISGGSACPVHSHIRAVAAARAVQWSTALGTSPLTIITQNQTPNGRLAEIEQVVTQSLGVWSGVKGSTLQTAAATVTRTTVQNACGPDGVNSICFNQADLAFTPGVLAFTRVITADRIGVQFGSGAPSSEVGEILDADIYFNPSDSRTSYATPLALTATPAAYDVESILTHEMGHALGFSHSAVWSAMMFPFAPTVGTFSGTRPSQGQRPTLLWEKMTAPGCEFYTQIRRTRCEWAPFAGTYSMPIRYHCRHRHLVRPACLAHT